MHDELDHAIKTVCDLNPNCLLDLFFGRNRTVSLKGIEDAQIRIPQHFADKAWRVTEDGQEACILLEAIAVPDRRDFKRFKLKNAAVEVSLGLPTVSVLVYLYPGEHATFPDRCEAQVGGLKNENTFARILLWEHKDRILSGELRELAPFLSLFEKNPDPEILKTVAELLDGVEDPDRKRELKSVAGLVASRHFTEEIIKQYLQVEFLMIKEKTYFTELLEQREQIGERKGRWLSIRRSLLKKLGQIPIDLETHLHTLSDQDLDSLAADLLDFQSLDDLRHWLGGTEN